MTSAPTTTTVKSDLPVKLAQKLGLSKAEAERYLDTAAGLIKDVLLAGDAVTLKDFATFKIVEERAHIVKDPETGHQFISPATKKVSFRADEAFRQQIERTRLSSIMLAMSADDPFARVIEFHFSRVGWRVQIVSHVETCLAEALREGAHLCIVDHDLPGCDRLILELKTSRRSSRVPLVAIYPKDFDPQRADAFRVLPDEHLREPFEVYKLLTLAEGELARSSEEEVIFEQQVKFKFSTREAHLERANELGAMLFAKSGLTEEGQVALGAAFREAIGNAAQHGNRDDAQKHITVEYYLDKEKITVVATDEGAGFDHARYTLRGETRDAVGAARERHLQGRVGGLGIMLMLKCTDKIEYNDIGNSIILTKRLKA